MASHIGQSVQPSRHTQSLLPRTPQGKLEFHYADNRWCGEQTGAIDDLHKAVSNVGEDEAAKREEGKQITSGLAKLKYEVQHDRALTYVNLFDSAAGWRVGESNVSG